MTWEFPGYEVGAPVNWDFLETQFQWLREMRGVPQDATWHAEGDVFVHTKMVVEALLSLNEFQALGDEAKYILFTAALLHDVEKRSCTKSECIDGVERIVSPRHALKGEYTARSILYRELPTPFEIREQIAKLVRLHGLPLWAIDKPDPRKSVIEASLAVDTSHLAMLARADVLGRICPDQHDILDRIELFSELCRENQCFGASRAFKSTYGRYVFLNKDASDPDYEPYDDFSFEVILMAALPGTGKDSYIQKHLDLPVLSLDDIRREHGIDPTDKRNASKVIVMGKERARELLRAKKSFVFNATNVTKDLRGKWLSLFTQYGAKTKIVYLEVPYHQLITQNMNRSHSVPLSAINKMLSKLQIPSASEAHDVEYIVTSD